MELRWLLTGPAIPEARRLEVVPEFGGVGAGPNRDDGWVRLAATGPVPLTVGGPPGVAAAGPAPAGRYRRVFVAASSARGAAGAGSPLTIHIEPIARGLVVRPGAETIVDIELVAQRVSARRPALFVKDAKIAVEGDAGEGR